MIKTILTHITFFALLLCIYGIFCVVFDKGQDFILDTGEYVRKIVIKDAIFIYAFLAIFVFCINLIKSRKNRWLVVLLLCLFLTLIWFIDSGIVDNPVSGFFVDAASINLPFLPPRFWCPINDIDNFAIRVTTWYLVYFWGSILYWYGIYFLSKKIVAWKRKK